MAHFLGRKKIREQLKEATRFADLIDEVVKPRNPRCALVLKIYFVEGVTLQAIAQDRRVWVRGRITASRVGQLKIRGLRILSSEENKPKLGEVLRRLGLAGDLLITLPRRAD